MTELPFGMSIVPLDEDQIEKLTGKGSRELVSGFGYLTRDLDEVLAALATRGAFAYIETEYFGGSGAQAAVFFSAGSVPTRLATETHPINAALKLLGVVARSGADEFDTLGLGRFRNLERLGLKNKWGGAEPAPIKPAPVSMKARQNRLPKTVALIGMLVLVLLFWAALTVLTNAGFDFALPNFSQAR